MKHFIAACWIASVSYFGFADAQAQEGQEGSSEQYRMADVLYRDGTFFFKSPVSNAVAIASSVGIPSVRVAILDDGRKACSTSRSTRSRVERAPG